MTTVEKANYVLEKGSARTCVEQIVDLPIKSRYLGLPAK